MTQVGQLNEAQIAAKTGTGLTFTGGSSYYSESYIIFSVQDANQLTENIATDSVNANSGTLSLVRSDNSLTFSAIAFDNEFNTSSLTNPVDTISNKNPDIYLSSAFGYQADSSGTSDVGWSTAGSPVRDAAIVAVNIGEGGAPVATISTNDDPIRLGTTFNYTVSNFSGPITSAKIIRNGIEIAGTSVSDTGATLAALAQGLVIPEPGTGATLELSDGTDTATTTLEFLPDTGFTYQNVGTVSGALVEGDWGEGLGLQSTVDGYITRDSDSAIATHVNDGSTTWLAYNTSLVYSWDAVAVVGDNGGLTSITLTNSSGGSTERKLTYSKLTGVKLTSSKLEARKI
jgi:hypothetical protein